MAHQKINILSITPKDLKAKKYLDIIPEYYKLSEITENNLWHSNQNVLDHVIAVFASLKEVLKFRKLGALQKKTVEVYLSQTLGTKSRKEILTIATLLHDIAKIETFVKNADGTTNCPSHELAGAKKVKLFSSRFGLNKIDEKYVERIIKHHGYVSEILKLQISTGEKVKYLKEFKDKVKDVAIELLLLLKADVLGCDLEKNDKDLFSKYMSHIKWMLNELIRS